MNDTWTPERALFIYAHPDDVDFSAAGTAAKWARAGSEVTYVILTDGNAGSHEPDMTRERLGQIRRAEQEAAAAVVGAKECIFLGYQDGLLEPTLAARKRVVRLIRQIRPQAVVCGDPRQYFSGSTYINHPDHRAAARIAVEAVFPAAEMNLLYPDMVEEGLTGHKPNYVYVATWEDPDHFVDVSDTIALKIEALRQHRSQMGDWDPEPWIRARHAEIGRKAGCAYAEPFRRMTLRPTEDGGD
ncbi:MAG: PIG-L deacetylase family protein [Anaerolineae bacterium]|jgi:LmbE family N-acetylglucosaminyl deacetylase